MNTGFQKLQITDPNKLKAFIEGTTGSILAILNVSSIIMLLILMYIHVYICTMYMKTFFQSNPLLMSQTIFEILLICFAVHFIFFPVQSINPLFQSLNTVLYSNNPADLPLTDLDAAASLPYDTDIPDGNISL